MGILTCIMSLLAKVKGKYGVSASWMVEQVMKERKQYNNCYQWTDTPRKQYNNCYRGTDAPRKQYNNCY